MQTPPKFWEKVYKTNHCWFWLAGTGRRGYGKFGIEGKTLPAHRISWELHNGKIPEGLYVCHKCDTTNCVNPAHLFLGTAGDNSRDRARKGRASMMFENGEKHPNHKLTEKKILEIKKIWGEGKLSQHQIAKLYGVHQSAISRALSGKRWPHLQGGFRSLLSQSQRQR